MSDKEKVRVYVVFGFQITRVTEDEGALETTTYEAGQEVELEAGIAREEEHRNRVRIIRAESVVAVDPSPVAEEPEEVAPEVAPEAPAES